MATINFDTSNKNFREILGNGLKYQVPRFQRDYAWTDEQWGDLWQDIEEVITDSDEEHYMGYLVLQRTDEKTFIIIDGQQRLTTITLIIIAGLYYLQELIEKDEHAEENKQRLDALRSSYIGALDPVSLTVENKLTLNRNNQEYFKTYLASLERPRVSRIKKSERQLADACRFFQDKIRAAKFSGEQVANFIDRMASLLLFTTIRVGSEVNAYRVFETLNARGVQLSTPDLLKNFLFAIIDKDQDTHELRIREIETQWGRVLTQLGKHDFTRYLLTEWNRRNPLARKNDLFKRIKRSIDTPESAFNHLRNLDRNAEVYAALQDAKDEFWRASQIQQQVEQSLTTLNLFNVIQPQGILLSAWEKWDANEFTRLLRAIEVVSIRYNVVCQKAAKDQEGVYNTIARGISDGSNFEDTLNELRRVYPSDEEFKHAFSNRTFKTRQTSKKVRHLLARIERQLSPDNQLDEASLTLEHILPEHPDDSWVDYFGEEGVEEYAERLGNMTLVSAGTNQELGQRPFAEKKQTLAATSFAISQKAANYPEWERESIDSRQQWMADQACSIWRIAQFD